MAEMAPRKDKVQRCNRPGATPRKCDPVGSNRLERPTIMASVATQSTALVQQRVAAKKVTRSARAVAPVRAAASNDAGSTRRQAVLSGIAAAGAALAPAAAPPPATKDSGSPMTPLGGIARRLSDGLLGLLSSQCGAGGSQRSSGTDTAVLVSLFLFPYGQL